MTIHADMQGALTEVARVRAMLAQGIFASAATVERLGAALACLEDAAERVRLIEGSPIVPRHFLPQLGAVAAPLAPALVVDLAAAKRQRALAKAPAL
jgi:hypothetical protein